MSQAKVYRSGGLVGKSEWAEYYVVGGTLRQKVNAYLRVLAWLAKQTSERSG